MQQINLYQASLRRPRQVLSLAQVGLAAGVLLGVLLLGSGLQWWGMLHNQQLLQTVKTEQAELEAAITALTEQLASSSNDSELKKTLSKKETELQDKQFVLEALTGRHFGNNQGFAEQFTGLARQHLEGIWLTGLYIHAGGEKLNLQGSTYEPELVPLYLQRLAQEPSFTGIEFKTFLMQRAEKSSQIDFDLRSSPKEPG